MLYILADRFDGGYIVYLAVMVILSITGAIAQSRKKGKEAPETDDDAAQPRQPAPPRRPGPQQQGPPRPQGQPDRARTEQRSSGQRPEPRPSGARPDARPPVARPQAQPQGARPDPRQPAQRVPAARPQLPPQGGPAVRAPTPPAAGATSAGEGGPRGQSGRRSGARGRPRVEPVAAADAVLPAVRGWAEAGVSAAQGRASDQEARRADLVRWLGTRSGLAAAVVAAEVLSEPLALRDPARLPGQIRL